MINYYEECISQLYDKIHENCEGCVGNGCDDCRDCEEAKKNSILRKEIDKLNKKIHDYTE